MADTGIASPMSFLFPDSLTQMFPPFERNLLTTAALFALLSLAFAVLILCDTRLVAGVSTWLKPWKFAVSLGLHLGTLALLWPLLAPTVRDGWIGTVMVLVLLATSIGELGYIASQSALGQASHYNLATAYTRIMYQLMGIGAVLLVGTTLVAGLFMLGAGDPAIPPALRRAVAFGMILSGGLGFVTGGFLGAHGGHFVGTPGNAGSVIPIFGWSREVGDLRVSHFIGLHALQALPIIGLVAVRISADHALAIVNGAGLIVAGLSIATLAQALAGMPLLR